MPEKRFGGKGQSAVVGTAKRARLVMKRRKERRRGGRKRLGKRMRIGSDASDRAERVDEGLFAAYEIRTRLPSKSAVHHTLVMALRA